jgi:hypothetical protein
MEMVHPKQDCFRIGGGMLPKPRRCGGGRGDATSPDDGGKR